MKKKILLFVLELAAYVALALVLGRYVHPFAALAIVPLGFGQYLNPYPVMNAGEYAQPYNYGVTLYSLQAIRWGLSRGILTDLFEILSISPNTGPAAGGTAFVVRGSGFKKGATVSLHGTLAVGVVVLNSRTIVGVSAAHVAGAGDVVVTNPGGATVTLVGGYTYT